MQVQNVEFRCGCGTGYCSVDECWNPRFIDTPVGKAAIKMWETAMHEHETGACAHPGTLAEYIRTPIGCNYCGGEMFDARCGMCGEA